MGHDDTQGGNIQCGERSSLKQMFRTLSSHPTMNINNPFAAHELANELMVQYTRCWQGGRVLKLYGDSEESLTDRSYCVAIPLFDHGQVFNAFKK
jgi:hypothetical protein